MKLRDATLLLVLGWYLMAPPKVAVGNGAVTWDMNAPLSRWMIIRAFNSASECQDFRAAYDEEMSRIRPIFDVSQCIATDDPRLRS